MLTEQTLRKIAPNAPANVGAFVPHLLKTFELFEINTVKRQCMFLAQTAHESGGFRYVRELGSKGYFQRYEGRKDLGNIEAGDGYKYRGRGLIQITGRANYMRCGKDLGLDLLRSPELLETPQYACISAGWFWKEKDLNSYADAVDVKGATKRINGGLLGLDARKAYYDLALEALTK